MSDIAWFGTCAAIAVLVALFARHRGWGMALPVLLAGALVSLQPVGPSAPVNPEVVLIVVLAPLVFGEALGSSYLDLRKVSRPVLALAIGLVLATTLIVGVVVASLTTIPLALAFALGAILAPTDAVAVSSVARKAGLPRRLISILEGESLVNDGTGLTLLRVATVATMAGSVTWLDSLTTFTVAVVGGVGVGLAGGWTLSWIADRSRDAIAANGLVLVAPFGIYLVAEEVHGSGILAVVVAGLMLAHVQTSGLAPSARLQSVLVWRHLTFLLQAFAFFLVGMELTDTLKSLDGDELSRLLPLTLGVTALLIVTRLVFVSGMFLPRGGRSNRHRLRSIAILSWAGARGPVSGLAAFSLPAVMVLPLAEDHRDLVLAITFCVILITLLLSMTLAPLARWLGIRSDDDSSREQQIEQALAYAALGRLEAIAQQAVLDGAPLPEAITEPLRARTLERLASAQEEGAVVAAGSADVAKQVRLEMLMAEQEELLRIRDEEGLPDAIVRPVQLRLDRRALAIDPNR